MKFEHFALNVPDARAHARWYVQHVGFTIARSREEAPFTHFLADETGRTVVELYTNPKAAIPDYAAAHPLCFHVAVVAADARAERARLEQAGATLFLEEPHPDGSLLIMMRDPWGGAAAALPANERVSYLNTSAGAACGAQVCRHTSAPWRTGFDGGKRGGAPREIPTAKPSTPCAALVASTARDPHPPMSKSDYSAALRSLDSALALVHKGHASRPDLLRLRIRRLALQLELLRARMRQPIVPLDRN